ncbi:MAG TPA: ABC transporter ATP-binding protein [Gemmatimonadales bacterium]|nr:ABC transporter ATP-binding protein [Gemmatimonadales bacterium]
MTDLAIETRGLGLRLGRNFALADVSLAVPTGAIYGFLGPNGSGKTTTIRALLGLYPGFTGAATLLGLPIPGRLPDALGRTGYVPERPHLYRSLTVAQSLEFHSAFHPRWDAKWVGELAAHFGLASQAEIGSLSKGETAKLMLLQALGQKPELLMLDEPTDGLDPVVRRDVLAALLEYVERTRATVFISSHLVHELERICDWVGVMDQGRLVAQVRMEAFKHGIKRIRVPAGTVAPAGAAFTVIGIEPIPGGEEWVVRDWTPETAAAIGRAGVTVREVIDLDLEEAFVELLRSFRRSLGRAA